MDLGLKDRVFVVTAASSGLGRATATQLVAEGARVVLVARRAEVLEEAVTEFGSESAVALVADLAVPETADRAIELALQTFGRLDGALVSVGGPPAGPVRGSSEEDWRGAFESVFLPAVRITNLVLERTTVADPAIAWVLSQSYKQPIPGLAISNGLRPGLAMLVKQFADEAGPDGARVVGLAPGRVATERVEYLDSLASDPAANRATLEAQIPLRRYGQPEEFGRVATFLLSPGASYLTGCVIPVEGGATRTP